MREYRFLIKPLFFIFNLLFATWLVFYIEKISPSNFGEYKHWFEDPPKSDPLNMNKRKELVRLISDYKKGAFDSIQLERSIENYLVKYSGSPNK